MTAARYEYDPLNGCMAKKKEGAFILFSELSDLKARLAAVEAEYKECAEGMLKNSLEMEKINTESERKLEERLALSEAAAGEMRAALKYLTERSLGKFSDGVVRCKLCQSEIGEHVISCPISKAHEALSSEAGKKALDVIAAAEKLVEKYESNPLRNINPPLNWGLLIAALDRFHGRTPEG